MKNVFNNPMFVIALGVLAAAMLIWTLAKPFLNQQAFAVDANDSEDWMDDVAESKKTGVNAIKLQSVSIQDLYWDKQPARDPFSSDIVIKAHDVKKVKSQVNVKLGDKRQRRPVLSALVAGEQSKFAVIDGQIVQEGDRVSGLSVNKISGDGVWLSSGMNAYRLTLSGVVQD